MIKKPIRLADIARVARVHETTVSLALRGSTNIAEATRQKIKLIADQLGYHANPAFQALARYSQGTDFKNPQVLYVTDRSPHETECSGFSQRPYRLGALRCLARAGFNFEHFVSTDVAGLQRKIAECSYAGIILGSMSERSHILGALAFEKVLTVKIGGVVRGIRIPAVLEDTLSMMRIAMLRAKARGAQRIGFILPSSYDEFVGGDWDMAYLRSQMEVGEMSFLPILRSCCRENGSLWNQEDGRAKELGQLCAWIDQWRPDCVIGFTEQTKSDISELGLNIPDDLAYIHLLARPSCSQSAGLQDHREFVGEIAAELLIRAIRQRREPPLFGTKTVVESHWQNGASLPAKRLGLSADDSGRFEARLSSPIELFRV